MSSLPKLVPDGLESRLAQALEEARPRMSRSALAERLKVSAGAVSHWFNGNRVPDVDMLGRIARETKVDAHWLITGSQRAPSSPEVEQVEAFQPEEGVSLAWVFEPASKFGRNFGNASVYATPRDVRTYTRELGQNSLDNGLGGEVVMRVRIYELSNKSDRYRRFLKAAGFAELGRHIGAASTSEYDAKLSVKLAGGFERLERGETLVLVVLDDFGTTGLVGDEFDSHQPFAALVRDNLNSKKQNATAGGVFGVGAKVNFSCSSLATVLFASKVYGQEERGTRLIGKSELTYHEFDDDEAFSGPGWLGVTNEDAIAESAWLNDDHPLLEDLMLSRGTKWVPEGVEPYAASGTSVMVVGFVDPKSESASNTAPLMARFAEEAARSFWPAMMKDQLTVWVERYVGNQSSPVSRIKVDPREHVGPLCDAFDRYTHGELKSELVEPGDVVSIPISFRVPGTKKSARGIDQYPESQADCRLVVRLADADEGQNDPYLNQVGFTRGRAMITRYVTKSGVVVGALPFHAVLLTGTMVGTDAEFIAVEQFLRVAEPPAHDRWEFNDDLGEKYTRGSGARLKELFDEVHKALQQILRPKASDQDEGPDALRRLLILPGRGKPKPKLAKIRHADGRIVNGAWEIDAEISISPIGQALEITPRVVFEVEEGRPVPVALASVEVVDGNVELEGQTFLALPRTKRFRFRAVSDSSTHPVPASQCIATIEINVRKRAA